MRGGENIPVGEIEEVLARHERIAEVALVGAADSRLGERAVACVRLKAGTDSVSLADLQAFLENVQVTKQYWPEGVVVLHEFPRSPSGKIKKHELRTMLAEDGLAATPEGQGPR